MKNAYVSAILVALVIVCSSCGVKGPPLPPEEHPSAEETPRPKKTPKAKITKAPQQDPSE